MVTRGDGSNVPLLICIIIVLGVFGGLGLHSHLSQFGEFHGSPEATTSSALDPLELERAEARRGERAAHAAEDQAALSFLSFAALSLTVLFAYLAWQASKRSADAAHDALADGRADAALQANRFEQQLGVALAANTAFALSSERRLRAYLGIKHITFQFDHHAILRVCIKNYGQTPARNVRIRIIRQFAERPDQMDSIDTAEVTIGGVIEPGQSYTAIPDMTLIWFLANEQRMRRPDLRFFVFGAIEYGDISEGAERRRTFAFECDSHALYRGPGEPFRLGVCDFGNESA